MSEKKIVFKTYPVWQYDQEQEELSAWSKKGWQLEKGGLLWSRFVHDTQIEYRYAVDYNSNIADKRRYRMMYEEMGWEYVNSTCNGWHYFRKPYEEGVDEEEYEIYTDQESIDHFLKGRMRLAFIAAVVEFLITILCGVRYVSTHKLSYGILGMLLLAAGLCLLYTAWRMNKKRQTNQ